MTADQVHTQPLSLIHEWLVSRHLDGCMTADDRFDLFHLLEAGRPPVISPEEPTPVNMRACQLMPYQRRCLAWMMAVESGYVAYSHHQILDCLFD